MNGEVRQVFLSHASGDKELHVRPFAQELDRRGISYWLDEAEIVWGDKISQKINEGLRRSRYVIVFLSDSFIGRNWPELELSAALSRENSDGQTVVLPLLIADPRAVFHRYPLLRDKLYLRWDEGVSAVADHLETLLGLPHREQRPPDGTDRPIDGPSAKVPPPTQAIGARAQKWLNANTLLKAGASAVPLATIIWFLLHSGVSDYLIHQRGLCDAIRQGRYSRGARLAGANLELCSLQGVKLTEANLRNARLAGARLNQAHLESADLEGASLAGAVLYWVQLKGAKLRNADLQDADLRSANLKEADLAGADLRGADLTKEAASDKSGADFTHADLRDADLRNTKWHGARFDGAFYCSHTKWPHGCDPRRIRATRLKH